MRDSLLLPEVVRDSQRLSLVARGGQGFTESLVARGGQGFSLVVRDCRGFFLVASDC